MNLPMSAVTLISEELLDSLSKGQEQANVLGRSIVVSVTQPVPSQEAPLAAFATGKNPDSYRTLWARPSEGFWLVSIGSVATLAVSHGQPFAKVRQAYRSLLDQAVIHGPEVRGVGPVLIGGFRFDPQTPRGALWHGFPDGLLVLPRFLFTSSGGNRWLTVNTLIRPGSDPKAEVEATVAELEHLNTIPSYNTTPVALHHKKCSTPPEKWTQWVQQALCAINSGKMTKVVLARRMTLHSQVDFSTEAIVTRLSTACPECSVFAIDTGSSSFVGATPEVLARLEDRTLSLSCLAGTVARGATPDEDQQLARQLLKSEKDQREHAMVVAMVAATLNMACQELHWDAEPQVIKLGTVQHLATLFTGRPKGPSDILRLVELLHPTPAVGGVPTQKAMDTIRQLEGDRGWYAAPIGWVGSNGEGEFNVAIRSALVQASQATLFAGAGIVHGSDPQQELDETELKFQPLLAALGW